MSWSPQLTAALHVSDDRDRACAACAANRRRAPTSFKRAVVPRSSSVSRSFATAHPTTRLRRAGRGSAQPGGAASASPAAFSDATEAQSSAERAARTLLAGTPPRVKRPVLDSITHVVRPIKLRIRSCGGLENASGRVPGIAAHLPGKIAGATGLDGASAIWNSGWLRRERVTESCYSRHGENTVASARRRPGEPRALRRCRLRGKRVTAACGRSCWARDGLASRRLPL